MFRLALSYFLAPALALALSACGNSAAEQPDVMVNLATVQSGPAIQAQDLEGAIARQPRNASLYARRAAFRLDAGEPAQALRDIEEALRLDDGPGEYYFLQARARRGIGQLQSTLKAAEAASRHGFASPQLSLLVGETNLAARRYQDALDHLDRTLQQEPENAAALFYKGMAYVGLQDTVQAFDFLRASVAREPRQAEILHQLAFLSNARRQPQDAAIFAARGLALAPTYGPLWYDNGRQYDLQDRPDSAQQNYLRALRYDTTLYRADYRLGMAYVKQRRHAEALPHLQRALRRSTLLPNARQLLAESYEALRRPQEAAAQYQQLVRENPGNKHWSYMAWKAAAKARGESTDTTTRRRVAPIEPILQRAPVALPN
jgi:tetratricopeptide (TPR) repeat protein